MQGRDRQVAEREIHRARMEPAAIILSLHLKISCASGSWSEWSPQPKSDGIKPHDEI